MQYSVLYQELLQLADADRLPLHMPGHKRRLTPCSQLPYEIDLTEITGADHLHAANGILKKAMSHTAELFRAQESYYLVNGSTGGILAGIHALAPHGSEVIVARNCHKAVYHALELRDLKAHFLFPEKDIAFEIDAQITPDAVADALRAHPQARTVIITSPTYEGVISDVASIAAVCHAAGVPLFVDGAHGCHLDFCSNDFFPKGPLSCQADLVVESMHKTLPSLTQTALLHLNSELVPADALRHSLEIYETSSPSYPLMASLDACTRFLEAEGAQYQQAFADNLKQLDEALQVLSFLKVLCYGQDTLANHKTVFAHDPGKLLIRCNSEAVQAADLNRRLREDFHAETEMLCGHNILAMLTLADGRDEIRALAYALLQLDREYANCLQKEPVQPATGQPVPEAVMTIAEAVAAKDKYACAFQNAEGNIAGEYVYAYPPGIPLVVPGERLTKEILEEMNSLRESGTNLLHSHGTSDGILCLFG